MRKIPLRLVLLASLALYLVVQFHFPSKASLGSRDIEDLHTCPCDSESEPSLPSRPPSGEGSTPTAPRVDEAEVSSTTFTSVDSHMPVSLAEFPASTGHPGNQVQVERTHPPPSRGYLSFTSKAKFNNFRRNLLDAIAISYSLNRTLLLPDYGGRSLLTILNLTTLDPLVRTEDQAVFLARTNISTLTSAVFCVKCPEIMPYLVCARMPLQKQRCGVALQYFSDKHGKREEDLLTVHVPYHAWSEHHLDSDYYAFRCRIAFHDRILEKTLAYRATFPPVYVACHLRLGDFKGYIKGCAPGESHKQSDAVNCAHSFLPPGENARRVNALFAKLGLAQKSLYVSTNERSGSEFEEFLGALDEDIAILEPYPYDEDTPFVDVMLSAAADYFVGIPYSTFSGAIFDERHCFYKHSDDTAYYY